ncbi:FUSC family protein [Comamonas sp. 17RB]|uniref:FUSC family protein n=1 Tax=Comamonas sp. 17RB TaxID=3047025 RepID=UPI0024B6BB23|nr:FUSC family protein [Comamonas sp. 17RB]MDI9855376.1 FUSC family protein [Comamonas sp. 17RB]
MRTALAGFVALAVAYALGLEHPHWAAMSAWASSQPMREHLLSRGIYRFAGSVVGVAFAVALVLSAQGSLWVLAVGLALWGALCAFLGNLQRGYMVYGCMLAGYSAAMVVLLHHGGAEDVWPFAGDRMLTVVTGVLAALCISWCFAPRRKAAVLIAQSRQALAAVLDACVARLHGHSAAPGLDNASLLVRLAEVEELLELYPEGSRTARNTSKAMHWQQLQALELVYHLGQTAQDSTAVTDALDPVWAFAAIPADADADADTDAGASPAALADALQALAQVLRQTPAADSAAAHPVDAALREAIAACEALVERIQADGHAVQPGLNALYLLMQEMRRAVRAEQLDLGGPAYAGTAWLDRRVDPLPLHRDWVGAREAAIRAGGTLLFFGLLWAWTGWSLIAFGMLGLSVMLLVFSAFENPNRTMTFVLRGQLIGAALALLCQWLVWPWAQSGWQMVWMLLPFALLGGLVFAHKRTAAGAMDTNMAMLILLAPVFPYAQDMGKSVTMALAVVSGPALAWLVYRCIYPTNAQRRMRTLAQMMVAEVPALAQRMVEEGKPGLLPSLPASMAVAPAGFWQAQLHHRLLRLVRWADKTQHPRRATLPELGLALRATQSTMLQLQQWRRGTILVTPQLRRTERRAELALRRMAQWGAAHSLEAQAAAGQHAAQAWQALAAQPGLPVLLAAEAQRVARRYLPELCAARRDLQVQ